MVMSFVRSAGACHVPISVNKQQRSKVNQHNTFSMNCTKPEFTSMTSHTQCLVPVQSWKMRPVICRPYFISLSAWKDACWAMPMVCNIQIWVTCIFEHSWNAQYGEEKKKSWIKPKEKEGAGPIRQGRWWEGKTCMFFFLSPMSHLSGPAKIVTV